MWVCVFSFSYLCVRFPSGFSETQPICSSSAKGNRAPNEHPSTELREQHPPHDALRSPPTGMDSSSCKTATVGPWEPTIKITGFSVRPADVRAHVSRWFCEAIPDPCRLQGNGGGSTSALIRWFGVWVVSHFFSSFSIYPCIFFFSLMFASFFEGRLRHSRQIKK